MISPKFYYLADAPETDPDGNETEVRFSRKMKKQYIVSVKDEKQTSFVAFYNEETHEWEAQNSVQSRSSAKKSSKTSSKASAKKTTAKKSTTAKKTKEK